MKKKFFPVALIVSLMLIFSLSASAYWGEPRKISYISGENFGDKMGIQSLPKMTDVKTVYFDCGYRTSWTKPTCYLVNTGNPVAVRSNGAKLDNGIVTATSFSTQVNYYYNVKIVGAWSQYGTDTMTFRFNPQ